MTVPTDTLTPEQLAALRADLAPFFLSLNGQPGARPAITIHLPDGGQITVTAAGVRKLRRKLWSSAEYEQLCGAEDARRQAKWAIWPEPTRDGSPS